MAVRFKSHGEFTVRAEGRLLISEAFGPWNKELVEQWAGALFVLAKPLGGYVGISVVRGSMLCPPDALVALHAAISYGGARLQCLGNALVAAADVEGRTLLLPTYEKLYDPEPPHGIFLDLESARAWGLALLAQAGF
ncbi:MAG: hypothetical protein ACJ8GW_06015 [Massilia sp.]